MGRSCLFVWHSSDLCHCVSLPCHPSADGGFPGTHGSCRSPGTAWPRTPWDTPLQTYRVQVLPQMSRQRSWDKEDRKNRSGKRGRKQKALDKRGKKQRGGKSEKNTKGGRRKAEFELNPALPGGAQVSGAIPPAGTLWKDRSNASTESQPLWPLSAHSTCARCLPVSFPPLSHSHLSLQRPGFALENPHAASLHPRGQLQSW